MTDIPAKADVGELFRSVWGDAYVGETPVVGTAALDKLFAKRRAPTRSRHPAWFVGPRA